MRQITFVIKGPYQKDNRYIPYHFICFDPETNLLKDTVVRQNPDAIIIDDNVNGTNGDALSFRIKTDKMIGYIPVVLLIKLSLNNS